MNIKLLSLLVLALGIMPYSANVSYADNTTTVEEYNKLTSTSNASVPVGLNKHIVIYGPPLGSSMNMDVLTNQKVNFEIENRSNERLIFEITSKNIAVEIPKKSTRNIEVTFDNPIDKHLYYKLDQLGSNLKPGVITVTDYTVPHALAYVPKYSISDEELRRLTLLKNDKMVAEEQPIAKAGKTVAKEETKTQSESFIRGYW